MRFDGLKKALALVTEALGNIRHTLQILKSLVPKKTKKTKPVVGRLTKNLAPESSKEFAQRFDFKRLRGISFSKMLVLIALIIILMVGGAVLLWDKLSQRPIQYGSHVISTQTSEQPGTKIPDTASKPEKVKPQVATVKESTKMAGFLPGPSKVIVKPEVALPKAAAASGLPKPESGIVPDKSDGEQAQQKKPKIEAKVAQKEPDWIQPYASLTGTVVDTVNPQFLLNYSTSSQQKVAIIVSGLGIDQVASDFVIDNLPENVTVAINPYTEDASNYVSILKDQGLDVLMMLILDSGFAHKDQGRMTLRVGSKMSDKNDILDQYAFLSAGCSGFYAVDGASFLKSYVDVDEMLTYLSGNQDLIIMPTDVLMNQVHKVASKCRSNYVCVTLDDPNIDLSTDFSDFVKRTGYGILAFNATTKNLNDKINQWIKVLSQNNIDVVPISTLTKLSQGNAKQANKQPNPKT